MPLPILAQLLDAIQPSPSVREDSPAPCWPAAGEGAGEGVEVVRVGVALHRGVWRAGVLASARVGVLVVGQLESGSWAVGEARTARGRLRREVSLNRNGGA